jgi:hypothetical protein
MAYVNSADVAQVRKELKEAFPKFKFGVRKDNSMAIRVTIKSGPEDFTELFMDEYAKKRQYAQINPYHIEKFYPIHAKFLNQVVDIIKTAPARGEGYHKGRGYYNNSDAMIDYFDTAFYFDLNIGAWDKPYEVK